MAAQPVAGNWTGPSAVGPAATVAGSPAPGGAATGRPPGWLRLLAGVLPFVVTAGTFIGVAVLSIARGWQPTSDNAVFAWRAWDVVSRRPPLLGAPTHGYGTGHQVFAPGPIVWWLLALPTHLEPGWGPLLGAALIAGALSVLTIAAARAWRGDLAGLLAALAVLLVCTAEHRVVLDPIWTPWLAALAFMALLACALPLMAGRLGWAVGVVVTASVAGQAHVLYLLPAAVVTVGSIAMGTVVHVRRASTRRSAVGTLAAAALAGIVLWLPTMIDQVANTPGNLVLLWDAGRQAGPTMGYSAALHGLASAVSPDPSWAHTIPATGPAAAFLAFQQLFDGPLGWAFVGWVPAVVAVWWAPRHGRFGLRDVALLSLAANTSVLVAVASVPATDVLELSYLGSIYVPIGILTWMVVGYLAVDLVGDLRARRRMGLDRDMDRHRHARDAVVVLAGSVLVLTTGFLVSGVTGQVPSGASMFGGPTAVRLTDQIVSDVSSQVSAGVPFRLRVTGPLVPLMLYAVQSGAGYRLYVNGWRPQFDAVTDEQIGIPTTTGAAIPQVTCHVDRRRCRVSHPR